MKKKSFSAPDRLEHEDVLSCLKGRGASEYEDEINSWLSNYDY